MVIFEFDENKSQSNLEKHGIDIHTAQGLRNDSDLLEIPANTSDKPRFLVIAMLNGKHWSGVITYRGDHIRIRSGVPEKRRYTSMKAHEFDAKFESDDDILGDLDLSQAKRPMQKQKRVNVDFPAWMLESLDKEASRVGVTRQSIIKIWLAERLETVAHHHKSQ
ncbi:type II toxin-antitoxin system BrnA family antitoxin [Oceanospirillum maris]|uniref:type II toxin-antitoxin system BrnA family antitoxin n=1 Tax=Oceanospirillum maris TaxID=64977 RepID=UPI001B7FB06B|nr:BrnT family toxin [Oceanospirillum maris]